MDRTLTVSTNNSNPSYWQQFCGSLSKPSTCATIGPGALGGIVGAGVGCISLGLPKLIPGSACIGIIVGLAVLGIILGCVAGRHCYADAAAAKKASQSQTVETTPPVDDNNDLRPEIQEPVAKSPLLHEQLIKAGYSDKVSVRQDAKDSNILIVTCQGKEFSVYNKETERFNPGQERKFPGEPEGQFLLNQAPLYVNAKTGELVIIRNGGYDWLAKTQQGVYYDRIDSKDLIKYKPINIETNDVFKGYLNIDTVRNSEKYTNVLVVEIEREGKKIEYLLYDNYNKVEEPRILEKNKLFWVKSLHDGKEVSLLINPETEQLAVLTDLGMKNLFMTEAKNGDLIYFPIFEVPEGVNTEGLVEEALNKIELRKSPPPYNA